MVEGYCFLISIIGWDPKFAKNRFVSFPLCFFGATEAAPQENRHFDRKTGVANPLVSWVVISHESGLDFLHCKNTIFQIPRFFTCPAGTRFAQKVQQQRTNTVNSRWNASARNPSCFHVSVLSGAFFLEPARVAWVSSVSLVIARGFRSCGG